MRLNRPNLRKESIVRLIMYLVYGSYTQIILLNTSD